MTETLFDLPAPARPVPPPVRPAPPIRIPTLPLSCRWCGSELTTWCSASDALPETGSWSAADRILAEIMTERRSA